jgi:hypothetical protein
LEGDKKTHKCPTRHRRNQDFEKCGYFPTLSNPTPKFNLLLKQNADKPNMASKHTKSLKVFT